MRIENVQLRRRIDDLETQARRQNSIGGMAARLQAMAGEAHQPTEAAAEPEPAPAISDIPISRGERW